MNAAQRKQIQSIQALLVAHKGQIGYRQLRPMGTRYVDSVAKLKRKIARGFSMDCSESCVLICHVVGVKDPTGNGYGGYGNTESMLNYLPHYFDARLALPGAFVVFNSDRPLSEQHVAQVHEKDDVHGDPIVFTHGNAADPRFLKLAWLQAGFSGRTTFLSAKRL